MRECERVWENVSEYERVCMREYERFRERENVNEKL